MKLLHLHLGKGGHAYSSDWLVVRPLLSRFVIHTFTLVDSFGLGVDDVVLTFEFHRNHFSFDLAIGA